MTPDSGTFGTAGCGLHPDAIKNSAKAIVERLSKQIPLNCASASDWMTILSSLLDCMTDFVEAAFGHELVLVAYSPAEPIVFLTTYRDLMTLEA